MMNARIVFMVLLAMLMAVGAAFLANYWALGQRVVTQTDNAVEMGAVVVAATDIPLGHRLELTDVNVVQLPKQLIPGGVFSQSEAVVGKVASQPVLAGDVLREGRITEHLGGSTLAAVIEPGMRAVSVKVNEIIGVAGFLLPGNRVDILSAKGRGRGGVTITTLLQDVKILAVDQTSSTDKNQPVIVRAVTVELSPKQAEILVKATKEGSVQLTLRNPIDVASVVAAAPTAEPAPKPAKKPAPRTYYAPKVTTIRGTSVSTSSVSR